MRGFALLVLFAAAGCSTASEQPSTGDQAVGGNSGSAGTSHAVSEAGAAGQMVTEAGAAGVAGATDEAGAPGTVSGDGGSSGDTDEAAGGGGLAGAPHTGAGGSSAGATGSQGGLTGSGGASAGASGTPNQCSGFKAYSLDVGTCISVTGDYQQQTDLAACSASGIVLRDHCSTCASWTAVTKPLVVLLAVDAAATLKRFDADGSVCPSNCKYICK